MKINIGGARFSARPARSINDKLRDRAASIEKLFLPGAKVTIIVRNPSIADADFITTNDDLDLVEIAMRNLMKPDRSL
jgi:hypothetical protein